MQGGVLAHPEAVAPDVDQMAVMQPLAPVIRALWPAHGPKAMRTEHGHEQSAGVFVPDEGPGLKAPA